MSDPGHEAVGQQNLPAKPKLGWLSRRKAATPSAVSQPRASQSIGLGRMSLFVSAGLCLLLAALLYLLKYYPPTKEHEVLVEVAQHLSVAFVVACVSIIGIEYNARRRAERELNRFVAEFYSYRERVSKDVFEAVLGRIVQEAITEEVKEILRNPFMKTNCQYTIRFMKHPKDPQLCLLRRDLSFEVKNISEAEEIFPVRSTYTCDEDLPDEAWMGRPYHLTLTVNGEDIRAEEYLKDERGLSMSYDVPLPPHSPSSQEDPTTTVFIRGEEPMRIIGNRSSYVQSTPMDGLEVIIENNFPEAIREVLVNLYHPGKMDADLHRDRYVLRRALLPGQGFEVVWKVVERDREST